MAFSEQRGRALACPRCQHVRRESNSRKNPRTDFGPRRTRQPAGLFSRADGRLTPRGVGDLTSFGINCSTCFGGHTTLCRGFAHAVCECRLGRDRSRPHPQLAPLARRFSLRMERSQPSCLVSAIQPGPEAGTLAGKGRSIALTPRRAPHAGNNTLAAIGRRESVGGLSGQKWLCAPEPFGRQFLNVVGFRGEIDRHLLKAFR